MIRLMAQRAALASDLSGLADRFRAALRNQRLATRAIAAIASRAPDERLALASALRLGEQSPGELKKLLRTRQLADDVLFCLGSSELIGAEFSSIESDWAAMFLRANEESCDSLIKSIVFNPPHFNDRRSAAQAIAAFKRRIFLRIAIGDLLDRLTVAETALAMSALADECIRAAYTAALDLLGDRGKAVGRFCVLAMGKLGAGELNLSSDIDLIYLHEATADQNTLEVAARLAESITELLAAGSFRVDMRLRPGGRYSPLVTTVNGAIEFYESLGQTWERAALLRTRPVAGALEVGRELLTELTPFIYRRYLDFDTLRQLRAMKRQIEAELRDPAMVERNIKLGRGGIRELEFIVQALMLIYGGRDPRLRTEKTFLALQRLETHGYVPASRAQQLADAYSFLRDTEHKLQVIAGLQTHVLPSEPAAMRALAARLGLGKDYDAIARLSALLKQHRDFVATQFRETLAGGEDIEVSSAVSPLARAAWDYALDPGTSQLQLKELGFAGAKESSRHLLMLAREPEHVHSSPRRRELVDQLGPLMLDEIARLPDPDLALKNLADFIASVGARTSFLALLEQHPATRRILLRLFASSAYLSTIFIRHPDMLDTLVRSDIARPRRTAQELRDEVRELTTASTDFESKLDALRVFRHQEFLRISIADLAGDLDIEQVESELTALAEAVLSQALEIARAETALRFAIPPTLKMCTIAMGRLGASEMSYNSDLDLIFVFDDRNETAESREVAARLTQKLIAVLESRTREGYAYKLDLRLRPSGNAGPLVTSLDSFREYHRMSSAVWERQALVRARVVAGDAELGAAVESAREEFVFVRSLTESEVTEIHAMRIRMEREIGYENGSHLNIKQGPGGLVDVEFLVQMLALRYGARNAGLRLRGTNRLVTTLEQAGIVAPHDAAILREGYLFLSRLENRLRIESDQPAWAVPTNPAALGPLARRMGFEGATGAGELLAELLHRRARIRAIFEHQFAREQSARH